MAERLDGKTALITGGSRGIGRAIAAAFFAEGANVVIVARHEKTLRRAAEEIGTVERTPLAIVGDVSREADATRMVEETVARFGRLDLLVNSAGICILGPVVDFRVEDWDALMVINLRGTFLCCRAAVRQMLSQGGHAQIINVVSNEGFDAHPTVAAYDASKHALIGFTRALRQEVQPRGIRVSALCPMSVDTGMRREVFPDADDSRWLDPREIAEAAVFMATRTFFGGIREMVVGLDQELGGEA